MNYGVFATQLNRAHVVLRRLGLIADRVIAPPYARYSASDFRNKPYLEIWRKCFDDRLFDFRLKDDSLLQFRATFSPLIVSYTYYECPFLPLVSLEDYLDQERAAKGDEVDDYDLLREYDLLGPVLKPATTPARYDYAPHIYEEGVHPASHIHFGHGGHIRLGTKRILRPLSFLLFVIRQYYPDEWRSLIGRGDAGMICRNVSENLDLVAQAHIRPLDALEMYLS